MKVWVEDKELTIFRGAKTADAVRKYSEEIYRQVHRHKKKVYDRFDNEVALDGELTEGTRLFIRE